MLRGTILSSLCLLLLAGGWAYSGSILPSTTGASSNEAVAIWAGWAVNVAIPLITGLYWLASPRKS